MELPHKEKMLSAEEKYAALEERLNTLAAEQSAKLVAAIAAIRNGQGNQVETGKVAESCNFTAAQYAELEEKLAAANDELSAMTEANRKLKAENADLRGDKRSAEERCSELEKQLVEVQKNSAVAEKYAVLERQYREVNAEYQRLKAIVDEQERLKRQAEEQARKEVEERARLETSKKLLAVGKIVKFGRYMQNWPATGQTTSSDNSPEWPLFLDDEAKADTVSAASELDRREQIEWFVLAEHKGHYLLISKYGLDARPYHKKHTEVIWENCSLRGWLNGEFFELAFSAEEQAKILRVRNQNPDNAQSGTSGGRPTDDRVFLLSIDEAQRFFADDNARICKATKYAITRGARTRGGVVWWWLRSPGDNGHRAVDVFIDGVIYNNGLSVHNIDGCVRPALWVSCV